MKILAIADEECASLWDFFDKSKVADIDLIISCGDLDPRYLSFLVTMTTAPVLYVHGNHDGKYDRIPPEGCTCIEDDIFVYEGVRILGLGGSMRYTQGIPPEGCTCIEDDIFVYEGVRILGLGGSMRYTQGDHQYTEKEMQKRVRKLRFKLFKKRGFDILVTHSPAYQLNDGRDLPHQGFQVFLDLLEKYKPKYFLHGHVHLNYARGQKRYDQYRDTTVVNAFERCIIEI